MPATETSECERHSDEPNTHVENDHPPTEKEVSKDECDL